MTKCPVPKCDSFKRKGQLLCTPHWRRVPALLKRDIRRYWLNRDIPRWRLARKAAIAMVGVS